MIDYTGVEVRREHVEALRTYLADNAEAELGIDENSPREDVISFGVLLYGAFCVAARRKFSPAYSDAQVIRYVADMRIRSGEYAQAINPRLAEGLLYDALGKTPFEPADEQEAESALIARAALLGALLGEADLDEAGMEDFISESTEFAREWVAARQDGPTGT